MATGTLATVARKYHYDLVHYVSAPIVYNGSLTVVLGKLPAGAAVIDGGVVVTTAFAGGTPQTLDLGVVGDLTDFASALVLTAAGIFPLDDRATASKAYMSVDTDVIATLSAGVTPSAGAGYAFITYIIANRAAG